MWQLPFSLIWLCYNYRWLQISFCFPLPHAVIHKSDLQISIYKSDHANVLHLNIFSNLEGWTCFTQYSHPNVHLGDCSFDISAPLKPTTEQMIGGDFLHFCHVSR